MKNKNSNLVKCTKATCQAFVKGHCLWKIDDRLIQLSKDKKYDMCEYLRGEVLKTVASQGGNLS